MKSPKNPHAVSASSISGTTVINAKTDTVGTIEDVMIDINNGEVLYAVLSVDTGFMNLGSKYFAIPLEEFQIRPEDKEAMLDVSKEQLEKAPGFDKDKWPAGPQHEFITKVNTFYGRKSGAVSADDANRPGQKSTGTRDETGNTDDDMRRGDATAKERLTSTPPNAKFL